MQRKPPKQTIHHQLKSRQPNARVWISVARREQDREDILREATALVERIEVEMPGYAEPLVIGFRRDGSASFFVGADPVYQFNSQHQLRRAYVGGKLIKAERGQLVSLDRHRTATQVQLLRTELDAASVVTLLTEAAAHLRAIDSHLRAGQFKVCGQVPESVDLVARVRDWLARLATPIAVAARPHAG